MWSWFGGQSAQKRREAPKEAILKLREQLEMLQKREKYLESQMAEQEAIAKKNVTTNKNAAKTALRRKKMHEKNLEQTQNQVMQLEQQVYSIETANINQETLYAMNNAGTAMKQMHAGLTIDKVDQMMEVLREQQQLADEVGRVLTETPLGEPIDEADLDEELAELEQETVDERMLKTGTVPVADHFNQLPAAANGELIKGKAKEHEDEEDEELERLQAEMALN